MKDNIRELQNRLFGAVHDFHAERTANMLDVLTERYGGKVLELVEKQGTNRYGLYRWHLERTTAMLNALKESFGPEVIDTVLEREAAIRREEGAELARKYGDNSLEKLVDIFTGGDEANIVERRDNEVLIRSRACLAGKIARELGQEELLYRLHCGLDRDLVAGFNDRLDCELLHTIMEGDDCCIHRLFTKPEGSGAK